MATRLTSDLPMDASILYKNAVSEFLLGDEKIAVEKPEASTESLVELTVEEMLSLFDQIMSWKSALAQETLALWDSDRMEFVRRMEANLGLGVEK
ncbi:hypothetical protein LCGC14_2040950 [marine sediment metagenome]|uniref:Uncharacterized protein n=1 Tax=marine sediment metagenome TaxID=412755 RepID=A0A0F9ERV1_9ZZZZ